MSDNKKYFVNDFKSFHIKWSHVSLFLLTLFILLILSPLASSQEVTEEENIPDEAPEGLLMEVRAPLGEFIRQTCYFPVIVTIENNGPPRTGQIRIVSEDPTRPLSASFIAECDIPTSSRKTYFLYPYFLNDDQSPAIYIQYIEKQTALLTEVIELEMLLPEERLWVEVADEGSDFVFLSRMSLPAGSSFGDIARYLAEEQSAITGQSWGSSTPPQTTLRYPPSVPVMTWTRPGNLPDHSEGYQNVDGLVLNTRRFYELSEEQRTALSEWVISGGSVIVWLGDDPARYQGSFLTSEVDASGGTGVSAITQPPVRRTLPSLTNQPGFTENRSVLGNFPVTYTPQASARVLLAEDDIPVLQHLRYGGGDILLSGLDLAALKLTSPAGLPDYFRFMMGYLMSVDDRPAPLVKADSFNPGYGRPLTGANPFVERSLFRLNYDMDNILQSDNLSSLPPLNAIAFFLLAYIVIVGPLNYFFLLKLRHREWLWYTIPVVVACFIIFTYSWALNTKGARLMLTRVNLVDVYPEQNLSWESSYFGIYSPAARRYDIRLENGDDLIRKLEVPPVQVGYYGMPDQQYPGEVLNLIQAGQAGGTYVDDAYIRLWSELHLESHGSVPPPGNVWLDGVTLDGNHLQGTINYTMNVDIDGAFLFYYTSGGFAGKPLELTGNGGNQPESQEFDILLDMYASVLSSGLTYPENLDDKQRSLRNACLETLSQRHFERTGDDEIILAAWVSGQDSRPLQEPQIRTATDETLVLFHLPLHPESGQFSLDMARGSIVGLQGSDISIETTGNLLLTDGELIYSIIIPLTERDIQLPETLRINIGTDRSFPDFNTCIFDHYEGSWVYVPPFGESNNRIMLRLSDYGNFIGPDGRTITIRIQGDPDQQGDIISINGIHVNAS